MAYMVAICDDDTKMCGQIEAAVNHFAKAMSESIDIKLFYTGEALYQELLRGEFFDIIFLDIQLKKLSGGKDIPYTLVEDLEGNPTLLMSLQGLVNFAGDKVTSLGYDIGTEGGIWSTSTFFSSQSSTFAPTTPMNSLVSNMSVADLKWQSIYFSNLASMSLPDTYSEGASQLNYASADYYAGALAIAYAQMSGDPFVMIREYSSWFGNDAASVSPHTGSIYTLPGKSVGTFTCGEYY